MIETPIFFDTEFTSFRYSSLISIGLVDMTGKREFYAELTDGWEIRECSEFVRFEVLSLLQGGGHGMGTESCRAKLKQWIEAIDTPVQLVTDLPAYDWFLIQRLLEDAWPQNLSKNVFNFDPGGSELPKRVAEAGTRARENYYQSDNPVHHALQDALALREAWIAALDCGWQPGAVTRM